MRYDDDGEFDDDDYCYYYCRDKWIDLERREKERVCVCVPASAGRVAKQRGM